MSVLLYKIAWASRSSEAFAASLYTAKRFRLTAQVATSATFGAIS